MLQVLKLIFTGVGHCIEASFALGNALQEGDKDDVCVREGFESDGASFERGSRGLGRVYKQNLVPIMAKMEQSGLSDIAWLSYNVTYGSLLETIRPDNPAAALDFPETEIVILSCLMARHAHRWPLRGVATKSMADSLGQGSTLALAGLSEERHDS